MDTYSVSQVSEILSISVRAVTKRCKKSKVRKINNKYAITQKNIEEWKTEIIEKIKPSVLVLGTGSQIDLQVQSLEVEIERLKNELSKYEIEDNERLEVFTNDQYILFEQRLKEWQTQRLELEHQEQLFNAEKKSLNELYEHYKNQFEYQRNQNEKVLEMHQRLLDIIGEQNKIQIQKNVIEAIDKEVINKDTWKTNK